MDLIIFFEAIGNLLFAGILMVAIIITSLLSVFFYMMKGLTPAIINKKEILFRKMLRNS